MKHRKTEIRHAVGTVRFIYRFGKSLFGLTLLISILNAVAPLIVILGNTQILNQILSNRPQSIIRIVLYFYSAAAMAYVGAAILQRFLDIASVRANERLKTAIYEAWEKIDFQQLETQGYFSKMMKSEASFRYSGGIPAFFTQFQNLIQSLVTIIAGLGLIGWIVMVGTTKSSRLALIIIMSLLLILLGEYGLVLIYQKLTHTNIKLFKYLMNLERKMNYFLMNIVNSYENIKAIKMWGLREPIQNRYRTTWKSEKSANHKLIINDSLSQIVTAVMASFATLVLFILVVFKIKEGLLPIGQLNTLFGSVVQMTNAVSVMIATWQQFLRFQNQMQYASDILPSEKPTATSGNATLPLQTKNVIEFVHVSFAYADGPEVLHDISLKLDLQGATALVGVNGSGKSTLIKLLLGLYRPTKGKILFNGQDISKFTQADYLALFKVVFQDYAIFDFSIAQNISASVDQDQGRLRDIMMNNGIAEWVDRLPNHEKTAIGTYSQEDFQPSGGQRQQIAVARAQYKHGIYQILDEPSAAMDPIKELRLFSKIKQVSRDTPSLFITHRIGAVTLANKIILMRDGQIDGIGTKSSLLRQSAYFRELWHSQADMYAFDANLNATGE
ncbi:ATP-binding cassette domain-containing protein [Lacticaseibacillus zeae]|uniref:ABC transporter ATP-binding protein n=1 Tax=Lacticaseibacillus zeae subsp. silagei TaxID=3068307 RepID=A0ABD7Z954_LACZE|nr:MULTISPECIES: ABC transporter ATP-binding protein [Lacticaseibacillus]MDE3314318.1 ABC transporter ATP-binding protein/permease [Lacticaseibacillus zeae]OFR98423.1 ABC transporter ATP-binding protein [Lactobacillus sp. HMSC068F07]WLV83725.1 ABC transporter ATP-binding protein [Lacticaseibacillus sp. NCIMB 15475]WLV86481.1 ABC transporter ATP-binding protein [Lacticaseibacillus sp. NCIMB 15474]